MRTPHKHAEVIKAWADGEQIQYRDRPDADWKNCHPSWALDYEYRVKPEPLIIYATIKNDCRGLRVAGFTYNGKHVTANVRFEETDGKITAVELIK